MTNLEFKKDSTWGPISNLALDSIVIVLLYTYIPGRKDFDLWYLRQFEVKRLRREKGRFQKIWTLQKKHRNLDPDSDIFLVPLHSKQRAAGDHGR